MLFGKRRQGNEGGLHPLQSDSCNRRYLHGQAADQIQTSVRGTQQQAARVGHQRAAVELRHDRSTFTRPNGLDFALLRLHQAHPSGSAQVVLANKLLPIRRPDALFCVEKSGQWPSTATFGAISWHESDKARTISVTHPETSTIEERHFKSTTSVNTIISR